MDANDCNYQRNGEKEGSNGAGETRRTTYLQEGPGGHRGAAQGPVVVLLQAGAPLRVRRPVLIQNINRDERKNAREQHARLREADAAGAAFTGARTSHDCVQGKLDVIASAFFFFEVMSRCLSLKIIKL